jgi:preprotein translocase subunit SecG
VIYLLYALHILVCFFLILVVLLQQGKGADLSVFGGGSTQTAFGARGAATLLHKLTVASFIAFIVTTVGIAAIQGRGGPGGRSIITDEVEREAPAAPVPAGETIPEAVLPEEGEPAEAPDPGAQAPGTESPAEAAPEAPAGPAEAGGAGEEQPPEQ